MSLNPTLSNQTLNCEFTNTTDQDVPLSFDVRRQENILNGNSSNYDVYVSRFFLDSSAIPSYVIRTDIQNEYFAGVVMRSRVSNYVATTLLPVKSYYGENEFVEAINQSIEKSYYYICDSMIANPSTAITQKTTYTNSSITLSVSQPSTNTYTFNPTVASGYADRLNYIIIEFDLLVSGGSSYAPDTQYCLYLTNSTSGKKINLTNNADLLHKCVFADYASISQDEVFNNGTDIYINGQDIKPNELLSIFRGDTISGPWVISFEPKNFDQTSPSITAFITFSLNITFGQSKSTYAVLPYYTPYLSINDGTNKLEINYTDAWKLWPIEIIVSPKIASMLGFKCGTCTFNNSYGIGTNYLLGDITTGPIIVNNILLPSGSYNYTDQQTTWKVFTQLTSTKELLCDIDRIDLTTTMNIELQQDLLVSRGGQKVLTSFLVDAYSATSFQFNMTGDNKRSFRMTQTGELTSFELKFVIRRKTATNISTYELVNIPPGMSASVMLLFVPVSTPISDLPTSRAYPF